MDKQNRYRTVHGKRIVAHVLMHNSWKQPIDSDQVVETQGTDERRQRKGQVGECSQGIASGKRKTRNEECNGRADNARSYDRNDAHNKRVDNGPTARPM